MKSFASFIKKAFPIPRSLILSDVSISFFDGQLSFFEFGRLHGSISPKVCGTLPFPRLHLGTKEEKGIFNQAVATLKAFASAKGYHMVRAILHEGDVYAFKMRIPTTKTEEFHSAIESALEENVPIPPTDALFEYEIISTDTLKNETLVAVTVISEKIVANYVALLQAAEIAPVMFETESRALARALVAKDDMNTHAVLAIEEHHSVVFIVEKGKATFSSSVDVGSADLARAVSKTFSVDENEARKLIAGKTGENKISETVLFESMIPALSTLADELGKALFYFKGEAQNISEVNQIKDIIVCGIDARIPGLVQYISTISKLPATVGSVWTNVFSLKDSVPELNEKASLGYGALIGSHFS